MSWRQTSRPGWRAAHLEDLVFFQRGFDITKAEQKPGEIPVVSSSGISSYHSESKADGPGVVIGRKGSLGTVHYIEGPYWPHDTTLWSKDLKGSHARFIYYFLRTLGLERYDVGSSNPTLNRNHIHGLDIKIPEYLMQKRIASILSAYDDLIENNRRRIQLLEQAARLLYKEWFVHLRFPGHEHVKIKDGVPEGWEKATVGHVSSFISRGITPKYDDEANGTVINQKCIRDGRVTMDLARRQSKEVPLNKLVSYGDVLVNSTGQGTLGRVAQLLDTIENCTVDSHVTISRPAEGVPVLHYGQHIASMEAYLESMGRGATNQTELSKDIVAELPFLRPTHFIAEQFELFAKDNADQVRNLTQQNTMLTKGRDLLLPRLMNGEVVV
jgi:type I restriction enzyme S subunit